MTDRTVKAVETLDDMRDRIGRKHGITDWAQRRTLAGTNEDEINASAKQLAGEQAHTALLGSALTTVAERKARATAALFGVELPADEPEPEAET